ncbi:uncharacterized protein LOC120203482 [Hibiscus syriacus]|uniref:uncharacterized protein LOC120203482 n=1 Tax=Hibiscus syriacus TaxID=106335 RepID=UPI00192092B0|nr:uncharacterized protein LOC120203482 [Hibiscus syriacus]
MLIKKSAKQQKWKMKKLFISKPVCQQTRPTTTYIRKAVLLSFSVFQWSISHEQLPVIRLDLYKQTNFLKVGRKLVQFSPVPGLLFSSVRQLPEFEMENPYLFSQWHVNSLDALSFSPAFGDEASLMIIRRPPLTGLKKCLKPTAGILAKLIMRLIYQTSKLLLLPVPTHESNGDFEA